MVVLLGLAAAVLYGSGDFLGGMASRRAHVLTVLTLVETAGVIVALAAAVLSGGPASLPGLAWGFSAGAIGGLGLIIFYVGPGAPRPMSVVAPVSRTGWPRSCRSRWRWPRASAPARASTRARCCAWSRSC